MFGGEFLGILHLTWGHLVMMLIGGLLIYLAISKSIEPLLLLPIGVGIMLANIPLGGMAEEGGLFWLLKKVGIETEIFPLFYWHRGDDRLWTLVRATLHCSLGAAAQFGIFATFFFALLMGFPLREAASIGIIGPADGPTSIYVSSTLAPHLLGPVAVAAYS